MLEGVRLSEKLVVVGTSSLKWRFDVNLLTHCGRPVWPHAFDYHLFFLFLFLLCTKHFAFSCFVTFRFFSTWAAPASSDRLLGYVSCCAKEGDTPSTPVDIP